MSRSITHNIEIPHYLAADIERRAEAELIKMGYGRLGIREEDMPGLHFARSIDLGEGYLGIHTGTRGVPGTNLIIMPMPYLKDTGNWCISSNRIHILVAKVSVDECTGGETQIEDPFTGTAYNLKVHLDPKGTDLRARWAEILPQAVMAAEIARSRSPFRRLARAIGL